MSEITKTGKYRWTVCALIFFATTLNYLDRQVIGILKPLLETDLNIGEVEYGNIVTVFQLFYGFSMLLAGRLIDKFGTKIGYSVISPALEHSSNGTCSCKRCIWFWVLERLYWG